MPVYLTLCSDSMTAPKLITPRPNSIPLPSFAAVLISLICKSNKRSLKSRIAFSGKVPARKECPMSIHIPILASKFLTRLYTSPGAGYNASSGP